MNTPLIYILLYWVKYRNFTWYPGVENFAETNSFRRVLNLSPKTLRKLCFSTKATHQESGEITVFYAVKLEDWYVEKRRKDHFSNVFNYLRNKFYPKTMLVTFLKNLRIMCRIPGTWHDSSTVIFTVEEFCQYRKKKKFCPWLLKNRASHCWTIVPVTVEELYQWQLNNRASQCWVIVPVIGEQSCQWLVNNRASDCWTTVRQTVQQVNALEIMSVRK